MSTGSMLLVSLPEYRTSPASLCIRCSCSSSNGLHWVMISQPCLLALESRYPYHIVDINEEVLGSQSLGAEGWSASDLIYLFQCTAPHLLQKQARLVVTAQKRGIYLLERSVTIDWTVRESVRARLRTMVKRLLRKYGYPPDKQEYVLWQATLCRASGLAPTRAPHLDPTTPCHYMSNDHPAPDARWADARGGGPGEM